MLCVWRFTVIHWLKWTQSNYVGWARKHKCELVRPFGTMCARLQYVSVVSEVFKYKAKAESRHRRILRLLLRCHTRTTPYLRFVDCVFACNKKRCRFANSAVNVFKCNDKVMREYKSFDLRTHFYCIQNSNYSRLLFARGIVITICSLFIAIRGLPINILADLTSHGVNVNVFHFNQYFVQQIS